MGVDSLMIRAVFLDRDGVLNRAFVREGHPFPPAHAGEVEILPGVPEALASLRRAGYRLLVVTNQPDLARGTLQTSTVDAIHHRMQAELDLDAFYVCPHDDADRCACRKPQPGMLLTAASAWGVDVRSSYMVGDRWRDVEAGRRAGCTTILIDYGYDERLCSQPDCRVASLAEAAAWILSRKQAGETGHESVPGQNFC